MKSGAERAKIYYQEALARYQAAQWEEALTLYDRALMSCPRFAKAHFARAHTLWNMNRRDEALAAITTAIEISPCIPEAYFDRGNVLRLQRRLESALQDYTKAISLRPHFHQALNNRAGLLQLLKRYNEALSDLDRLIALTPTSAAAHYNRGAVLLQTNEFDRAWDSLSHALVLSPNHPNAFGTLAEAAIGACAWDRVESIRQRILEEVSLGNRVVSPVVLLGQEDDPSLQRRCCEINLHLCLGDELQSPLEPLNLAAYHDYPIRIAYMSSNFGDHPVGRQIIGVLEHHDRSRFEIIGYSLCENEKSHLTARIKAACHGFYNLSEKSDAEAAAVIRQHKVHVLVDLNCQTEGWRPGITERRAAPIQVNYLGFAGTSGAEFIDYIIADNHTVAAGADRFFSERVVRLPDSFWPNDGRRPVGEASRRTSGLAEDALVFCAFNNHHKISRAVFECWMRLLAASPKGILWLRSAPEAIVRNLRRHAADWKVDPSRIVFAPVVSDDNHLARHQLADLFLDTFPYNAHTSASDALWMGLPVLTLRGQSFAGRVATSMLLALDLPELVTDSLAAYELKALELASDRAQIDALRAKLAFRLTTHPLFASEILTRNLEKAYQTAWSMARTGSSPQSFSVEPAGSA